jgi:hypothetical protein
VALHNYTLLSSSLNLSDELSDQKLKIYKQPLNHDACVYIFYFTRDVLGQKNRCNTKFNKPIEELSESFIGMNRAEGNPFICEHLSRDSIFPKDLCNSALADVRFS